MYRIEADWLIPGKGKPIRDGLVILDGSVISFAGPTEGAPKTPSDVQTTRVPAVMPGMWDCHGHFMGLRTDGIETEIVRTPIPVMASRVTKDAETALQAGFTSVREAGGLGVFLSLRGGGGDGPGPSDLWARSDAQPDGRSR